MEIEVTFFNTAVLLGQHNPALSLLPTLPAVLRFSPLCVRSGMCMLRILSTLSADSSQGKKAKILDDNLKGKEAQLHYTWPECARRNPEEFFCELRTVNKEAMKGVSAHQPQTTRNSVICNGRKNHKMQRAGERAQSGKRWA